MIRCLFPLLLVLLASTVTAQPCGSLRYQQRVFAQSFKTSNIVYGNAPSLPTTLYLGESVTQNVNLTMDVYQPFGDTLQKRPLVILSFGGAFLIGSKDDEDIQSVSDSLARRGYVTACINYRLGMNVADAVSAERAIYRALQDFSAAVRYFKEHATQYGIDTNYIYVGGVSAGGFAALHMALVDESERPASSFAAGGISPRPDLGCKDCSGNSYAHSSDVRGIINYWGAIGDVNWIKPGKAKPLVSFHGDQDLIVPYNTGFPFTALAILPQVSGSGAIKQRYDQIGGYNEHYMFPGVGHNIWGLMVINQFTPGPNQYYLPIYNHTADFLFGQSRPEKPEIAGADTVCPRVGHTYYIAPSPNLQYCWQIDGGQITQQNGNEVQVQWQQPGYGSLYATTINQLDAVSETDTFAVWVHAVAQAKITAPDGSTVCSGNGLPLVASTATGYQWAPQQYFDNATADSTLLTPLISGLYFLEVADSNTCTSRDSIYVTVVASPTPPVITQIGDTLYGGSENLTWYDDTDGLVYSGDAFAPNASGSYYIVATAPNGCVSISAPYVYMSTNLTQRGNTNIQVYPNPFYDRLIVDGGGSGVFVLYQLSGSVVGTYNFSGNTPILLPQLSSGLYIYQLSTPAGVSHGKLWKQ